MFLFYLLACSLLQSPPPLLHDHHVLHHFLHHYQLLYHIPHHHILHFYFQTAAAAHEVNVRHINSTTVGVSFGEAITREDTENLLAGETLALDSTAILDTFLYTRNFRLQFSFAFFDVNTCYALLAKENIYFAT